MSLKHNVARKPRDTGHVPERREEFGTVVVKNRGATTRELIVTSKGTTTRGDSAPVLFALLIRHGFRAVMALITLKMLAIALGAATATTGGHDGALLIERLFKAATAMVLR